MAPMMRLPGLPGTPGYPATPQGVLAQGGREGAYSAAPDLQGLMKQYLGDYLPRQTVQGASDLAQLTGTGGAADLLMRQHAGGETSPYEYGLMAADLMPGVGKGLGLAMAAIPAAKKAAGAFQEMTRAKKLAAGYYEMSDGGRTVTIENRPGIGWVNTADWDRGLVSDPWRTKAAAETDARKLLERNGEPLSLPTDEASRMARSVETGHTVDAYKGEGGDIAGGEYILGHSGRKDAGFLGEGIYATSSPSLANMYSQMKTNPDGGLSGPNVAPLRLKLKNPIVIDMFEKERLRWLPEDKRAAWLQSKLDMGHDGVVVKYPHSEKAGEDVAVEYMVPDPSQVRSKFAKFDPAKKNSANLLAGIAGAGLLGGPALQGLMQEEQY